MTFSDLLPFTKRQLSVKYVRGFISLHCIYAFIILRIFAVVKCKI